MSSRPVGRTTGRGATPADPMLRVHRALLTLTTAVLVVGLVGATAVTDPERGDPVSIEIRLAKATTAPSSEKKHLSVTGSVSGLHPGGASSLPLELRNTNSFDIDLTSLVARVSEAPAGCPASYLAVGEHSGHFVIPAHSNAVRSLPIALSPDAPNGCKNVRFGLEYSGIAVKA